MNERTPYILILGGWTRWIPILIPVLMFWSQTVSAQCQLVCKSISPTAPVRISVGATGEVNIGSELIVDASSTCSGAKTITVVDENGEFIANGADPLTISVRGRIGKVLTVLVRDNATSFNCSGYIQVFDTQAPQIACSDLTLFCAADTSANVLGRPTVTDNINRTVRLRYEDFFLRGRCGSDTAIYIRRSWIARDSSGNSDTCLQKIVLKKIGVTDVTIPGLVNLPCDRPSADTSITGVPTFQGRKLKNNGFCDFVITFRDDTTKICEGLGRLISRKWTILDRCTGALREATQVIQVRDEVAPTLTCPAPIRKGTDPGQCTAVVQLPKPTASDNCDPNPAVSVRASYGSSGFNPHFNVPLGTHTLTYTAIDLCGNSSVCTTTLTIVDEEVPTVVCRKNNIISLPEGGVAFIQAKNFDEGSKDNCKTRLYYKARRWVAGSCNKINGDDSPSTPDYQEFFDDYAVFCCNDVDSQSVKVTLRVYEVDPGNGPVDPARERQGGDLYGKYNDCDFTVTIRDELGPRITCPANKVVECTTDITQLHVFGSPIVLENCSFTLDSTSNYERAECNRGKITRTFTAKDWKGRTATCSQTITIVNTNKLTSDMIKWPKDYTIVGCGGKTDPKELPLENREPVVTHPICGSVGISYEDRRFESQTETCFQIFRKWSAIDLCNHDPADPSKSIFSYTQLIKVEDRTPPTLVVPKDTTFFLTEQCKTVKVATLAATGTDCGGNVTITNDGKYADLKGALASGTYPVGKHKINFRAVDQCGNTTLGSMTITVIDKKPPVAQCLNGLSTTLDTKDGQTAAIIDAKLFDAESYDDCGGKPARIAIRRGSGTLLTNPAEQITFTCADIGRQSIQLWVYDTLNNGAFCTTFIDIQDNGKLCASDGSKVGKISGIIQTETGIQIESVAISGSTQLGKTATGVDGNYQLPEVPLGGDYTIVPQKTEDPINGVTTIDLVIIQKHILGLSTLKTPYQHIAADVDKSGNISTVDLIRLRKLILNMETSFPNGNTSWRFIDANFKFPQGQDPLKAVFPEAKSLNNFLSKEGRADFVGIKVGDVNMSAKPNSLVNTDGRTTNGELIVETSNQTFEAGEEITVDFSAEDVSKVQGFQFTLDFDHHLLQLLDAEKGELPQWNEGNLGTADLKAGLLNTSWDSKGEEIPDGRRQLFSVRFKALRAADLATALSIKEAPTPSEAYNQAGELMQVLLKVNESTTQKGEGIHLYQNYPNPFIGETNIAFSLPKTQDAHIRIFDAAGRLVFKHSAKFERGYNELKVPKQTLPGLGVYYYQLSTDSFTGSKRMIYTAY